MIGQLLDGRYRIVKSLAAGGFGQTFIAEDIKQFNKICVVKQFKPSFSDPEALKVARRLFEAEAQLLNRLGDHDQIPHLLAYFEINQEFFLVQDFVEGHSLEREITVGKKLSEAYAIALLKSILEPLSFIHSQNVIHRDIKPANLIRRKQDGKIVLIDFGAVKELAGTQINAQGQTRVGTIIGTPGYMANEQGRGKPKLSSDIYATGLIIIQALTGKLPPMGYRSGDELYEDPQTAEILWRQDAQVSPEFAAILDRMICFDFRSRYPSAMAVKAALQSLTGAAQPITKPAINLQKTNLQKAAVPATVVSGGLGQNFQGQAPLAAPPKTHWAKFLFRAAQRFIGVSLLIMGLPIAIYGLAEGLNENVSQEDQEGAIAAFIIFGVPFTGTGSFMLWRLNRQVRKEKFDSDWLRQHFYQTLGETNGEVTVLRFAQSTQLSGKEAQKYLDARVKEFNGTTRRSPDGEILYSFKL
ncbi:serine/threonine protein kinase [Picosynechococcus sp. PCC 7003]|uniref:serine/threonine-protein kinase n=1 Tax=Picosynechococcus sp. PCC 7003 TaxID=374981 RepID=UPI000810486E|nr:serine/threonine-protein kinase [Picosynechococcus sp. PCC 7003]ANV83844.1 serine/threonine protein kinase [Picosynechococcus sp. PCC 7003]